MPAADADEVELELDPGRRRERLAAARARAPRVDRRSVPSDPESSLCGEVTIPRAIGSGERSGPRARCARPSCARLPRPSRLAAPISIAQGRRPEARRGRRRDRDRDARRPALALPHGHRDRAGVREVADLRIGEQATVMVSVRSARVRPTRRRNLRLVEAAVADASGPMKAVWFNQAYLAERLQPGTRLLLNGKLDRSGLPGRDPRDRRRRAAARRRRAGLHTTGIVPVHNATARALGERACASGSGRRPSGPATRSSRCRPSCARGAGFGGEADALRCAHFPDSPEQASARPRPARVRGALPAPGGAGDAPRRPARVARPGSRSSRRASSSRAGSTRFRSSPPTGQLQAFDEIDADLAAGRPMQRLLMGEVGSRQDRGRRLRDAARARGRPPGGDDGADRDARRAARDRPSTRCSPSRRSRSRCSPARPRRRGGARRSAGWRAASSGSCVGTHALIEPDVALRRASRSASSTSSTASASASAPRSTPRARATRPRTCST